MPTFQVRNRRTKMILGEVVVDDPATVLDALKDSLDCTIEEIAASLGSTVEEAKAALDIIEMSAPERRGDRPKVGRAAPAPRRLFS